MLIVFDNDEYIFKAIKAGTYEYLPRDVNTKDLYNGILEAINGVTAMNRSIAMKNFKVAA